MNLEELTRQAVQAALKAGELIRSYRDREVEVLHKEGGDTYASQVVTEVDRKAQDAILQVLGPYAEFGLAVLTEENEDDGSRFEKQCFWCIDPMDGTLPFIRKEPGYSVSIGLVAKDGSPQIGVVYDPVHEVLWQAAKGQGVRRNGEPWTLNPSSRELTFTYDRSFETRPERAGLAGTRGVCPFPWLEETSGDPVRGCRPQCLSCSRELTRLPFQVRQTAGGWWEPLGLCSHRLSV